MFGWFRPAALCASRLKRSTNCSSAAWRSSRSFSATLPAELLVLGEVDVGHPARAELPLDHVAPVEDAVDEGVGAWSWVVPAYPFDAPGRIACMSGLAIGAATAPPNPFELVLDDDRAGDLRVVGGREEDEPRVVDAGRRPSRRCPSCRRRRCPGSAPPCPCHRRRPIASSWLSSSAVVFFIACFQTAGCVLVTTRSAGRQHLLDEMRRHHVPPFATRRRRAPSAAASSSRAPGRRRGGRGRPARGCRTANVFARL